MTLTTEVAVSDELAVSILLNQILIMAALVNLQPVNSPAIAELRKQIEHTRRIIDLAEAA